MLLYVAQHNRRTINKYMNIQEESLHFERLNKMVVDDGKVEFHVYKAPISSKSQSK